ncbi:hypothetical protein GYMLUDRAFT_251579 [Collybiopsis luxurians FD-317 M1]|uniref:Uncharacterized protein n=1 Tax=Collybiopsis luxurians FD-317 M1 TaxID=944289 RepID=A0A0D0C2F2_9AGAR|nr:hypothetical protein GYMLUDRAFT_251579 [Collybiopsis luxurians FD-317 M1]
MTEIDDPLQGILSDAAHKYWEDPDGCLIVSSTFSPLIQKWVPILFTYANGATAAHYEYHFLILIQGVVKTALERNISITDELFAGVVDFSDPQHIEFSNAFVGYFLAQPEDHWSETQLHHDAAKLLKGCSYHFQKTVMFSSTPSYAASLISYTFTLFSTTDSSSTPSAIFDQSRTNTSSEDNSINVFVNQLKMINL